MASSTATKKPRGRPATGIGTQVQIRLQPAALARLDEWREAQGDKPTRPEAIRRLVESGLPGGLPAPDSRAYRSLVLKGRSDVLMEALRAQDAAPDAIRDWLWQHLDEVKGELRLIADESGMVALPHEGDD